MVLQCQSSMDDTQSDPQVVERLKGLPPFPEDVSQESQDQEPVQQQEEAETPQETPEEPTEDQALENSKNPQRTKEYIDKLKQERDEARQFQSGAWQNGPLTMPQVELPQFTPQNFGNLTQNQINETAKQLFDDNGYVDKEVLVDVLNQANAEARAAREEANKARLEIQRQRQMDEQGRMEREKLRVHRKYPQLDPDSTKFKPEYWAAVRDRMVSQLATKGRQDFAQAARELYGVYNKDVNKKDKEVAKTKENQLRNINATSSAGSGSQRTTSEDIDNLHAGVRAGKKGALAELLRKTGN